MDIKMLTSMVCASCIYHIGREFLFIIWSRSPQYQAGIMAKVSAHFYSIYWTRDILKYKQIWMQEYLVRDFVRLGSG